MSVIVLRHNTVVGDYSIELDGAERGGGAGAGRCTLLSSSACVLLPALGVPGLKGYVVIEPRPFSGAFAYTAFVGDPAAQLTEDNAAVAPENSPRFTTSVAAAEAGFGEDGAPLVWYRVASAAADGGDKTVVHRRHREFVAMGETVLSAYAGSALASSLPPLPARTLPFVDTSSAAFVEGRRAELAGQLARLEGIPRMGLNADFRAFLGLCEDGAREASVLFPAGAALGLTLGKGADGGAEVEKVAPGGPADASRLVAPGAAVSKVNGEDVLGAPYDAVLAKLKAARRPLVVHFFTPAHRAGAAAGGGGGAPAHAAEPAQPFAAFTGGGGGGVGSGDALADVTM